ncbi:putative only proline and serine are matching in the corresponding protein [Zalerion maritima]|uniref:Only proline and serine are matching in the corresponding protein n=1 Tax=Zalerion maritima TaxID=339359 RepID=A0AAD5RGX1_9PEZI|nr:putative only proline and serine are matching in the corresponding protein [Zalerion maritima]
MSPKLRPLRLPQLVEERRKRESQATAISTSSAAAAASSSSPSPSPSPTPSTATTAARAKGTTTPTSNHPSIEFDGPLNYATSSSAHSDIPSPVTPTFSQGHSRYASSASSFEMPVPYVAEHCSSPTIASQRPAKRILPDVKEDPLEQDEEEVTVMDEKLGLYDCLCDDPYCIHRDEAEIVASPLSAHSEDFVDYDFGIGSDFDGSASPRSLSKRSRKEVTDSPLSGIARFGSRLPSLARFKSTKRANLPLSPVSDLSLDSLSCDPSRSRSSSVSASGRYHLDRSNEPPMPPTPALSFFDSSDSIGIPQPIDIEKANARLSIEKDRSMATTPLLPPVMTATDSSSPKPPPPVSPHLSFQPPQHAQQQQQAAPPTSVSQQPTPKAENLASPLLPSPPLSSKPSVSEFRPLHASSEIPSIIQDEWSDRLGHANFTIMPRPYRPEQKDMEALRQLRADWDAARMAYGRHIARIGEHYGHTSKTYSLTEAKWRETQHEWQSIHDALVDQIADSTQMEDSNALERVPITVPKLHSMGNKFPNRGDEDIVGPMMRAVTMLPATGGEDRKGARFWRNLAEKVGLKR